MTLIIAFILAHLSWFAVAGSIIAAAVVGHVHGAATANAKSAKQVAAAKADTQVAVDNLNARKTADIQADADASKTAAAAAQERTDVENDQAALDDTAARERLLGLLHGDNPGAGKASAGADPGRR